MALQVLCDRGLVALGIPTKVDPRGHRRVSVAELVGDAGDGDSGLVKHRGDGPPRPTLHIVVNPSGSTWKDV
jgi:hypothetical protein